MTDKKDFGKVIQFGGVTTQDIDPDQVLEAAKGKLECVLIIGYSETENYVASSTGDQQDLLWILEKAKRDILDFDE